MKLGMPRGPRVIAASLVLPAAIVMGSLTACSSAPRQRPVKGGPVETGAGTLQSARKYLEGRWTLESFEVYPPGKGAITLKGSGTLLYDEMGNLKMDIRTDQATADALRTAGIDIRDGVISTEGRTAIDLQNRTLTYVLEGQAPLIEGPLSMRRPRHWVVDQTTLTLTTQDDAGKPLSVGKWKRSQ